MILRYVGGLKLGQNRYLLDDIGDVIVRILNVDNFDSHRLTCPFIYPAGKTISAKGLDGRLSTYPLYTFPKLPPPGPGQYKSDCYRDGFSAPIQFCFEYNVSGSIEARLEPSPVLAITWGGSILVKAGRTRLPKSGRESQGYGRELDARECLPSCLSIKVSHLVQSRSKIWF